MTTETNPTGNTDTRHVGHHDEHAHAGPVRRWVFLGFVAIAAFFLLTEHRAHFFGVLPYLLVLACPLMHFFMHHGHGAHEPPAGAGEKEADK